MLLLLLLIFLANFLFCHFHIVGHEDYDIEQCLTTQRIFKICLHNYIFIQTIILACRIPEALHKWRGKHKDSF